MFLTLYDSFLSVIYPQACRICEKSVESKAAGDVCEKCWRKTRIFSGDETLCAKCGAFLSENSFAGETFCRRCENDFFDRARAVGLYENALATAVVALKTEPFVPKRLQKLFVSAFLNSPFQDTTRIVPVPLSKRRFVERGFNQAAILAGILTKETGVVLDEQSLARTNHTVKHRAGMDKLARAESVQDAFEIKRPRLIAGERILLVDDVLTSGATVSNCAKALKEKGASRIYVLTVARAF